MSKKQLMRNAQNQHQVDSLKSKNDGTNPTPWTSMKENMLQEILEIDAPRAQ